MPFHDLNLTYNSDHAKLATSLAFSHSLGYSCVALNVEINGKLPTPLPVILTEHTNVSKSLKILSRITLTISDTSQNHRISALSPLYSLVALRPTNDKAFQLCCSSLDCDIISIDFTSRLPYPIKFKTVASALQRGIRFEICYSGGVTGGNDARRNLISGAGQLIRATRGRGIIVSSEAGGALEMRGPWDVVNLATVWGMSQERGKEAVCEEVGRVVRLAGMKRTSFRGVIDVVEDGTRRIPVDEPAQLREGPAENVRIEDETQPAAAAAAISQLPALRQVTVIPDKKPNPEKAKRKASTVSLHETTSDNRPTTDKPLSNREMKRQAKKARLDRAAGKNEASKMESKVVSNPAEKPKAISNKFPLQHEILVNKKKKKH